MARSVHVILQEQQDLTEAFEQLYTDYGCERLTIQTGGTLNGLLLRKDLIDYVDIVVAPLLVGGKGTSTLIDGDAITSVDQLNQLGVMKL